MLEQRLVCFLFLVRPVFLTHNRLQTHIEPNPLRLRQKDNEPSYCWSRNTTTVGVASCREVEPSTESMTDTTMTLDREHVPLLPSETRDNYHYTIKGTIAFIIIHDMLYRKQNK